MFGRDEMPGPAPRYQPTFTSEQIAQATKVARSRSAPYGQVKRAQLVLLLHDRPTLSSEAAARQLDQHRNWVRYWRKRWATAGFSLVEQPGRGRKARFSPLQVAAVKAGACELASQKPPDASVKSPESQVATEPARMVLAETSGASAGAPDPAPGTALPADGVAAPSAETPPPPESPVIPTEAVRFPVAAGDSTPNPAPRPTGSRVAVVERAVIVPPGPGVKKRHLPVSRYSLADIVTKVIDEEYVETISRSTVWRILSQDAIKPWRYQSWIFPRDPQFGLKAGRALDLYARFWEGQPLGADEYVLSADEKTSIQARLRVHPSTPPGPGRPIRVEHEYVRGGALQYLAAWDVHRARVFGLCEPKTGKEPFGRLVDLVMQQAPYHSARRVFWLVDSGSSHRGEKAAQDLQARYPNAVLVHLPVHASWLNQIEIYFSIVQRKVLTPNDFESLEEVAERLLAFQSFYNQTAKPFKWKFTRQDLERRLKELSLAA